MAARSIASLSLSFGMVSIPVKLYSATESAGTIRFNLLAPDGGRLKQQYVAEKDQTVVPRSEMLKGYEFEKDHFVIFRPEELKALEEGSRQTIDIVSFIPEKAVDPVYFDKAYLLAPDKRGGKPYALLLAAMRKSGRCALARWAWKSKQYVVQVRAVDDGLMLQQLLYADEVRSLRDLNIETVDVSDAELKLALQLVEQISEDEYDPTQFEDEEKKRILAAIDEKIAGKEVIASAHDSEPGSGQVIDMMDALMASLAKKKGDAAGPRKSEKVAASNVSPLTATTRMGAKRTTPTVETPAPASKVRARVKK